jgi:LmbE family N-acetylglucosaminyl deacetylase
MLRFEPILPDDATVLCVGAHCDDIEIGCGGALIELRARYPRAKFHWAVFSSDAVRKPETLAAAAEMLGQGPHLTLDVLDFRGSYFPAEWSAIKDALEGVKTRIKPSLVFTHFLQDRHQDHRVLAELSWNTFRDHAILEYEIAKFEGDLAQPNVYIPLSTGVMERKVEALMRCFPSQHSRTWFDPDLFRGHMRLRGIECNAPSRFAEAFHARKLVL